MMKSVHNSIAVMIGLVVCTVQATAAEITLRREVRLSSPVVRLGDVAEVSGTDSQRSKQLEELGLMPAPAPGTLRFLTQRELQDLLAAHGQKLSELRFSGHDRVAIATIDSTDQSFTGNRDISREAQRRANRAKAAAARENEQSPKVDSPERVVELERSISEYLNTKFEEKSDWKISLDLTERHWMQLATATSTPICSGGHEPWTGAQRFVLSFDTTKGSAHLPVYAEVARCEPVVVAIRPLERGRTITAADVELQYLEPQRAFTSQNEPIRLIENVIGLEASRAIQEGDILTNEHAKAPLLVRRGEEISVIAQGGGIRIRATARARQNGAHGDLIQVESLETRDRYDARVIGRGEVAVFTSSGPRVAGRAVTGRRY